MTEEPEEPENSALNRLVSSVAELSLTAGIGDPPQQFFADLRQMMSATRLYGVAQLLRAGTGATVAAAATRGILESAMTARWDGAHNNADVALATLSQERQKIHALFEDQRLIVPNWELWLAPLCGSETFRSRSNLGWPDPVKMVSKRPAITAGILGMSSAVADVLTTAGHASAAAAWMTVDQLPHAVGFEPTAVYRAVIAQAAGRAMAFVLDLPASHSIWARVAELTTTTRAVTLMPATDPPQTPPDKATARPTFNGDIKFWPTTPMVEAHFAMLLAAVSKFASLLGHGPDPYSGPSKQVNLSAALPYLTALSTAEVCFAAASGHLPADFAAISARMLLEEGARTRWMFGSGDEYEVTARYRAVLNAETDTRRRLRSRLTSHGVPLSTIASLLDALPKRHVPNLDSIRDIPAGCTSNQIPPYEQMIQLGIGYSEPGWLAAAYSLLSQVTHMTPLGLLHSVARTDASGLTLSHQMMALAVDVAALGVTQTITPYAAILSAPVGARSIDEWANALWIAAHQIHQTAQMLHFMD